MSSKCSVRGVGTISFVLAVAVFLMAACGGDDGVAATGPLDEGAEEAGADESA